MRRHKKLISDIGWTAIEKIVKGAFTFLTFSLVARECGAVNFGALAYALAIVAVATVISGGGIDSLIMQKLQIDRENTNQFVFDGIVIKLVLSCCVYIGLFLYAVNLSGTTESKLLIIVGLGVLFEWGNVAECYFTASGKFKTLSKLKLFVGALIVLLRLAALGISDSITLIAITYPLEALVNALILTRKMIGEVSIRKEVSKQKILAMLGKGIPVFVVSLGVVGMFQMDRIIVGDVLGAIDLGYYTAAAQMAGAFNFIPVVLGAVLSKRVIDEYSISIGGFFKKFYVMLLISIACALIISFVIVIFDEHLVVFVYGENYKPACEVLLFYTFSLVGIYIVSVSNRVIVVLGIEWLWMIALSIVFIFSMALYYYMAVNLGIVGVGISVAISWLCLAATTLSIILRKQFSR